MLWKRKQVDFKMMGYKNDMGKDIILDMQQKPADILTMGIQIANQESDEHNFPILIYKRGLLKL